MDHLNELVELLPPPAGRTTATVTDDLWEPLQQLLQLVLPADYRRFVELYGPGCINDELCILTPLSPPVMNIVEHSEAALEADREVATLFGPTFRYRFHPASPGLFPWAVTGNGHYCYWLVTEGAAHDESPVVVKGTRWGPDAVWQFEGGMTRFLVDLLTGRVDVPVLPHSWFIPPAFAAAEQ